LCSLLRNINLDEFSLKFLANNSWFCFVLSLNLAKLSRRDSEASIGFLSSSSRLES